MIYFAIRKPIYYFTGETGPNGPFWAQNKSPSRKQAKP